MNEPANFATNELSWYVDFPNQQNLIPLRCHLSDRYESPKYSTYGVYGWGPDSHLSSKTLCMTGKTVDGFLYDNKNLYGTYEARATVPALHRSTGKRGAIISRSTFPTAGQYGGHWLGDNSATWRDLQTSIVGIQEFNMFGLPYVGADICGFRLNTTEELCLRWQQLGAFYSFSR
ncbi:hypothetical protein AB6A40_009764 [Gnathostoma spinigerum]|uniref:Glycoside hydrolase family 31 TIM barrel domain-containing protein n=1 Tax=Gnathostoma spinigerum TaxID=75299 RepID=A0ABD6F243_9BILA